MGFVIWLLAGLASWVVAIILAMSKATDSNFHNTAFSPGTWFLAFVLFLVGLACFAIAGLCLYIRSEPHSGGHSAHGGGGH
jgi:hypothetical protein